jgi:hypothetical protein
MKREFFLRHYLLQAIMGFSNVHVAEKPVGT